MQTVQVQSASFEDKVSIKPAGISKKNSGSSDFKALLASFTAEKSAPVENEIPEEKNSFETTKVNSFSEKKISENKNQENVSTSKKNSSDSEKSDSAFIEEAETAENENSQKMIFLGFALTENSAVNIENNFAPADFEPGVELTLDQIDYLKSSNAENSLDFLIENAEEYTSDSLELQQLTGAQNLSVEDPSEFLELAEESNFISADGETEERTGDFTEAFISGTQKNFFNASLNDNNGSEDKISVKQISKSSRKNTEGVFSVIDERSVKTEDNALDAKDLFSSKEFIAVQNVSSSDGELNFTMNLTQNAQHAVEQNIISADAQTASADGSVFQQMLTQQIQANAPDFVKAGTIVLRDNNQGVINMNLKPEALGNVKISLELSDKIITGSITVSSKEAYEAFKQNLELLKATFEQQGFESAAFNLNLASDSSSAFAQHQQQAPQDNGLLAANRTLGNYVTASEDDSVPEAIPSYRRGGDYKVDMIA